MRVEMQNLSTQEYLQTFHGISQTQGSIQIYSIIKPKQRARKGKYGFYTPKETVASEELIRQAYKLKYRGEPTLDPVSLSIALYLPIPVSVSKKKHPDYLSGIIRPIKKPDIDNVAKTILDALNGLLYKDDSQVINLHITKHYALAPSTNIFWNIRGAEV